MNLKYNFLLNSVENFAKVMKTYFWTDFICDQKGPEHMAYIMHAWKYSEMPLNQLSWSHSKKSFERMAKTPNIAYF